MEKWDADTVLSKMRQGQKESVSLVMYVAEMGEKTCKVCQGYHGKIYSESDPEKPVIPIHPNCRCRYKKL